MTHDQILHRMLSGNERYRTERATHPRQTAQRRREMALVQRPCAAILACADSRVPPEIIFDEGLGDLFVVRVAGNFASPNVIGSLEFGVEALGVQLIMVLGHDLCAAVATSLQAVHAGIVLPGPLAELSRSPALSGPEMTGGVHSVVAAIRPAISASVTPGQDALGSAIDDNVRYAAGNVRRSPLIARRVEQGRVAVVGARYHLESGAVDLIA